MQACLPQPDALMPRSASLPAAPHQAIASGFGGEDVVDRLGLTQAGGGGPAADELTRRGPLHDVLVAGGVVIADERHLADGDGEQVEPARLGSPAEAGTDRGRVAGLDIRVALGAGGATDLELPLAAIAAGDHAVHQDP